MKRNIILIVFAALQTILISCNSNPIESSSKPGRRDYVWTTDTIKIPFSYLFKMWGSSPVDVWAVGQGGGLDQTIWHFDGTNWKTDGISRRISPVSIYGFSSNDIWLGGNSGLIWHYNGFDWEEKLSLTPLSTWGYSSFYVVYGNSSNDLYAAGFVDSTRISQEEVGIIFHYDGFDWKRLNIAVKGMHFLQMRKSTHDSNYYLLGSTINADWSDSAKLFSFDGKNLKEIYQGLFNNYRGAGLELINNKVYFGIDSGVYTYDGSKFNLQFSVNNSNFTQGVAGRNEKDIFLSMWDGIAHYNGTDIEYIIKDSNLSYSDMLVFDKELFVLCTDKNNGDTIIKRGKLIISGG